jgi:hypothetical protein
VAESVTGLEIFNLRAMRIPTFAVLVNSGHNVRLHDIEVADSGGFNPQHRNSGAGGIALEENTTDFEIRHCRFGGLRGTAVTLRATEHGRVADNEFAVIARDGIRVSDSKSIAIEGNGIRQIGFPTEEVDLRATCITFVQVTAGEIKNNTCAETLLGAIAIHGSDNKVVLNHLTALNIAHRDVSGIYLEPGSTKIIIDTALTSFRYGIFPQSSTSSISPSRQVE